MDCDWADQVLALAGGLQDLWGLHIAVGGLGLYFVWPRVAHGIAEIRGKV